MANRATGEATLEFTDEPIPEITRGSKAEPLVSQFLDSGRDFAKVNADSKTFASTIQRYIKANDLTDQVEVVTRKGADGERVTYLRVPQEGEAEAEPVE